MSDSQLAQFKMRNIGEPCSVDGVDAGEYEPTRTADGDLILKSVKPRTKYYASHSVGSDTNYNYTFTAGQEVTFTPPESKTDPDKNYATRKRNGTIIRAATWESPYAVSYTVHGYEILGDNGVTYRISRYEIRKRVGATGHTQEEFVTWD